MKKMHALKGRLDILPALSALLQERSVTAAAARMNVTQPAMSRTLEQLRRHFSDPLLVRSGAEMRLTPKAESLLVPLGQLLSAAEALYTAQGFQPATATRTFNVVIPDVVAVFLLPRLLEQFASAAPGCKLCLQPWSYALEPRVPLDLVVSTEVDGFPHYRQEPLFSDHDVLVTANKRTKRQDPLALDHVAVVAVGVTEDPVDRWLRAQGLARTIRTTVPHYLLAIHMVARAGLAAILPLKMAKYLAPSLGLNVAELAIEQEPDQQWLLHPLQHHNDAASRWLRDLVKQLCRA